MRILSSSIAAAALAVGIAFAPMQSFAADAPVGLGCAAGATLVIESNVLTCKSVGAPIAVVVTCALTLPSGPPASGPAMAATGLDRCPPGAARNPCGPGFALQVDYVGIADRCVGPSPKPSYQAPINK